MTYDDLDNYEITEIGNIGNYYGGLHLLAREGKHYWAVVDWDGYDWDEIPESLYDTLYTYEKARRDALPQSSKP